MAQKVVRQSKREEAEERELQEFIEQRNKARRDMAKRVIIILLCIGLVIAFCMPSISLLL